MSLGPGVQHEIRYHGASDSALFAYDGIHCWGFLYEFCGLSSPSFVKNVIDILIEIGLNL